MPRYFFNIRNGDDYKRDVRGKDLPDLGTVREAALDKARKMLAEDRDAMAAAEFEITEEGGIIVEAVRFSEADSAD